MEIKKNLDMRTETLQYYDQAIYIVISGNNKKSDVATKFEELFNGCHKITIQSKDNFKKFKLRLLNIVKNCKRALVICFLDIRYEKNSNNMQFGAFKTSINKFTDVFIGNINIHHNIFFTGSNAEQSFKLSNFSNMQFSEKEKSINIANSNEIIVNNYFNKYALYIILGTNSLNAINTIYFIMKRYNSEELYKYILDNCILFKNVNFTPVFICEKEFKVRVPFNLFNACKKEYKSNQILENDMVRKNRIVEHYAKESKCIINGIDMNYIFPNLISTTENISMEDFLKRILTSATIVITSEKYSGKTTFCTTICHLFYSNAINFNKKIKYVIYVDWQLLKKYVNKIRNNIDDSDENSDDSDENSDDSDENSDDSDENSDDSDENSDDSHIHKNELFAYGKSVLKKYDIEVPDLNGSDKYLWLFDNIDFNDRNMGCFNAVSRKIIMTNNYNREMYKKNILHEPSAIYKLSINFYNRDSPTEYQRKLNKPLNNDTILISKMFDSYIPPFPTAIRFYNYLLRRKKSKRFEYEEINEWRIKEIKNIVCFTICRCPQYKCTDKLINFILYCMKRIAFYCISIAERNDILKDATSYGYYLKMLLKTGDEEIKKGIKYIEKQYQDDAVDIIADIILNTGLISIHNIHGLTNPFTNPLYYGIIMSEFKNNIQTKDPIKYYLSGHNSGDIVYNILLENMFMKNTEIVINILMTEAKDKTFKKYLCDFIPKTYICSNKYNYPLIATLCTSNVDKNFLKAIGVYLKKIKEEKPVPISINNFKKEEILKPYLFPIYVLYNAKNYDLVYYYGQILNDNGRFNELHIEPITLNKVYNDFISFVNEKYPCHVEYQNIKKEKETTKEKVYDENLCFLIGLGSYKKGLIPLEGPSNDVRMIAEILKKFNYNIDTMLNCNATKENILNYLKKIAEIWKEKNTTKFLMIYFSGHGGPIDLNDKKSVLCLYDGEIEKHEIMDIFTNIKNLHIMLIVDSCYSGNLVGNSNIKDFTLNFNRIKQKNILTSLASSSGKKQSFELQVSGKGVTGAFTDKFIDVLLSLNRDNELEDTNGNIIQGAYKMYDVFTKTYTLILEHNKKSEGLEYTYPKYGIDGSDGCMPIFLTNANAVIKKKKK